MPEQAEPHDGYVAVGRIVRPWGLHGDVKVQPLTDFADRFDAGAVLWVGGEQRKVLQSREQKREVYLRLSGIGSPEQAETLRGLLLEVPEADLHDLPEGDYYHHQLRGLSVRTTAGEDLGTIFEVFEPGVHSVLVVRGARGEVLIPFIDDVVRRVDLAAGVIEIDPIDGLLPEERPERRSRGRRPANSARRSSASAPAATVPSDSSNK